MTTSANGPGIRRSLTRTRAGSVFIALVFSCASLVLAQEKEVPKDSARVSIPGCARNRIFIVGQAGDHEPVGPRIAPGRRFRLSGPKKLLEEIKQHGEEMLEVTGLVRQSDLAGPGGVAIGGGIRIGGGPPRDPMTGDARRDPGYSQAVLDIESWRPLPGSCPER